MLFFARYYGEIKMKEKLYEIWFKIGRKTYRCSINDNIYLSDKDINIILEDCLHYKHFLKVVK